MERLTLVNEVLPEWLSTTFVSDNGEVYFPCGMVDEEVIAVLAAIYDGVPLQWHQGHAYAPTSWLLKNYRRFAPKINALVVEVKRMMQRLS